MTIDRIWPAPGRLAADTVLSELQASSTSVPFSDESCAFAVELSVRLFRATETRTSPDLAALAYWMRRSEIARLKSEFSSEQKRHVVAVPRGLVFHIPPANVDTIFVYSLVLSVLAGNKNIVRIPSKESLQNEIVVRIFSEISDMDTFGNIVGRTAIVRYGHQEEITAAFSQACDVRIVWGGDQTVKTVRQNPVDVHCKELSFPDRYSLAVFSADHCLAASQTQREQLAQSFFNDVFVFNQLACSSPQALVWVGGKEVCEKAAPAFYKALAQVGVRRDYRPPLSAVLTKELESFRAIIDGRACGYRRYGNALTVIEIGELNGLTRDAIGAGFLQSARVESLAEIVPFIQRKDQTLVHFGFCEKDLRDLIIHVGGRGLDRLVPIGQALTFSRYWDGFDLLHELTRQVYVEASCSEGVEKAVIDL